MDGKLVKIGIFFTVIGLPLFSSVAQINDDEIKQELEFLYNRNPSVSKPYIEEIFQKIHNNKDLYLQYISNRMEFPENDSLILNNKFMHQYNEYIYLLSAIDSKESIEIIRDHFYRFLQKVDERSALMHKIYHIDNMNLAPDQILALQRSENKIVLTFTAIIEILGYKKDRIILNDCLSRIPNPVTSIELAVFKYLSKTAVGDRAVIQKLINMYHDQTSTLYHDTGLKNVVIDIGGDVDRPVGVGPKN
jgi:hypothetical protein